MIAMSSTLFAPAAEAHPAWFTFDGAASFTSGSESTATARIRASLPSLRAPSVAGGLRDAASRAGDHPAGGNHSDAEFTRAEGRTVEAVTGGQETAGQGTGGSGPLRVVLGEDSVLLLAGLVKLLESAGFEVLATAGDGTALVEAVEREQPDLVIADVRMPPPHTDEGIRAALAIRGRWPGIAILVLSQYVEERYAADLLSANTSRVGYLLKDRVADVAEFLEALRRVAAGGTALDPEVVAQLLLRRGSDPLETLTQRERDVLTLMAEGQSNAEIGTALVITDSAVSKHINSIFAKLGLHPGDTGHRRVLAVLRYLGAAPETSS
jgi:DNA-binding NarL/FixJ family response regulator